MSRQPPQGWGPTLSPARCSDTVRGQQYFGADKAYATRATRLVQRQNHGQLALVDALDCLLADEPDEYCLMCDVQDDLDAVSREGVSSNCTLHV